VAQRITAPASAEYGKRRSRIELEGKIKALRDKGAKRSNADRDALLDLLAEQALDR
jgi:hypothetical protein